jgi:hypothetical protein
MLNPAGWQKVIQVLKKNQINNYLCMNYRYGLTMEDVAALLSGIEYKVLKLIRQHQADRADKEKLLKEVNLLKQTISEQRDTIIQLEEKIKLLKITKTLESREGSVEAKQKINELVREIDKCIGLLNT